MSLRCLKDVLKRSRLLTVKQDVISMSGKRRRAYVVLKKSYVVLQRLEGVWFTTFSGRMTDNVLKTSGLDRVKNVQFKMSCRYPIYDVLKMSDSRRLEEVPLMSSWRRPIYVVFRTSEKRCLISDCAGL